MKVIDLVESLNMQIVTGDNFEGEIKDCYICDLLSLVMARLKEGDAWITVQTNTNVVALASLAECACVIIPENIEVEEATIKKAQEKGIIILRSTHTAYRIAKEIAADI